MLPIVMALTGLCRGTVKNRWPSVSTMCLPCRTTAEPCLLQRSDGVQVVDTRQLGHSLNLDLNFADVGPSRFVGKRCEVFTNRLSDVLQGFLRSSTLRMATGKARTTYSPTLFRLHQCYLIIHKGYFMAERTAVKLTLLIIVNIIGAAGIELSGF